MLVTTRGRARTAQIAKTLGEYRQPSLVVENILRNMRSSALLSMASVCRQWKAAAHCCYNELRPNQKKGLFRMWFRVREILTFDGDRTLSHCVAHGLLLDVKDLDVLVETDNNGKPIGYYMDGKHVSSDEMWRALKGGCSNSELDTMRWIAKAWKLPRKLGKKDKFKLFAHACTISDVSMVKFIGDTFVVPSHVHNPYRPDILECLIYRESIAFADYVITKCEFTTKDFIENAEVADFVGFGSDSPEQVKLLFQRLKFSRGDIIDAFKFWFVAVGPNRVARLRNQCNVLAIPQPTLSPASSIGWHDISWNTPIDP